MNDEELVVRLKHGDTSAFDGLYEQHKNDALRIACLITGSRADGEDVVQETFIQCFRMIGQLQDPARFRPWLFRLLTREAWKCCRKRGREQPVAELYEQGEPAGESALSAVLQSEQSRQVWQALSGLDEKHRTAVVLYYFDEMPIRDIARVMGCMEGTVKSRLHTARRSLRQVLTDSEQMVKEAHA